MSVFICKEQEKVPCTATQFDIIQSDKRGLDVADYFCISREMPMRAQREGFLS